MRGPGSVRWTPSMIDEAAQLWAVGLSAAQIASTLGVARCAILGVSHRNRDRFPYRDEGAEWRARIRARARG